MIDELSFEAASFDKYWGYIQMEEETMIDRSAIGEIPMIFFSSGHSWFHSPVISYEDELFDDE